MIYYVISCKTKIAHNKDQKAGAEVQKYWQTQPLRDDYFSVTVGILSKI